MKNAIREVTSEQYNEKSKPIFTAIKFQMIFDLINRMSKWAHKW